jgi:hypothetical protein
MTADEPKPLEEWISDPGCPPGTRIGSPPALAPEPDERALVTPRRAELPLAPADPVPEPADRAPAAPLSPALPLDSPLEVPAPGAESPPPGQLPVVDPAPEAPE